MKKITAVFVYLLLMVALQAQTPAKLNPIIKSFGSVYAIPNAEHKPDPTLQYKLLVELTENAEKPDSLNEYLDAVATLINLHAVEGVPKENIQVAIVFRKMATYAMFGNEKFKEKFKVNNPNIQLIQELHNAGVEFYVCGQTMLKRNFDKRILVSEAKIASSGLTAITTFQMQGYAVVKF